MMAFDECPGRRPARIRRRSLALTERWLDRCFDRYRQTAPKYGHYQALFPHRAGCAYADLRARAAENVLQYDADGYAIGGLAVGEPTEVMYAMIEVVNAILPENRPRYLMGVGTPVNILEGHRPRRRHVRLRDAHAQRPQRAAVHRRGHHQHPQQEVGGRLLAHRPRGHGLCRYPLLEGLPAPPVRLRRDALPRRSPRCTTSPSTCGSSRWPASISPPGTSPRKQQMVENSKDASDTMKRYWPGVQDLGPLHTGEVPRHLLLRHRDDHRHRRDLRLRRKGRQLCRSRTRPSRGSSSPTT